MKIPNNFQLQGRIIEVIFDNQRCSDRQCLGLADLDYNQIILADEKEGRKLPESLILQTFYHECVHHFLSALGEEKLSQNEKFVDLLSGFVHQMLVTSKYDGSQN